MKEFVGVLQRGPLEPEPPGSPAPSTAHGSFTRTSTSSSPYLLPRTSVFSSSYFLPCTFTSSQASLTFPFHISPHVYVFLHSNTPLILPCHFHQTHFSYKTPSKPPLVHPLYRPLISYLYNIHPIQNLLFHLNHLPISSFQYLFILPLFYFYSQLPPSFCCPVQHIGLLLSTSSFNISHTNTTLSLSPSFNPFLCYSYIPQPRICIFPQFLLPQGTVIQYNIMLNFTPSFEH